MKFPRGKESNKKDILQNVSGCKMQNYIWILNWHFRIVFLCELWKMEYPDFVETELPLSLK